MDDEMRDDEMRFATDLYRGTASYYERYRLPYPAGMLADLVGDFGVSGHGRLLDLACGTGQLAFPLSAHFDEVWAVDQERDMVEAVRGRAEAAGVQGLRAVVSSAETLDVEPGYFELAVVGNAFHRLRRELVARRIFEWLAPGGHVALCWSSSPWVGREDWQHSFAGTLKRWQRELGAEDRIPAGLDHARRELPDVDVLSAAGFEVVGRRSFAVEHRWDLAELAGHIRSTSFLSASVLGDRGDAFDTDLAAALLPHSESGVFSETVSFSYDLARKPDGER